MQVGVSLKTQKGRIRIWSSRQKSSGTKSMLEYLDSGGLAQWIHCLPDPQSRTRTSPLVGRWDLQNRYTYPGHGLLLLVWRRKAKETKKSP